MFSYFKDISHLLDNYSTITQQPQSQRNSSLFMLQNSQLIQEAQQNYYQVKINQGYDDIINKSIKLETNSQLKIEQNIFGNYQYLIPRKKNINKKIFNSTSINSIISQCGSGYSFKINKLNQQTQIIKIRYSSRLKVQNKREKIFKKFNHEIDFKRVQNQESNQQIQEVINVEQFFPFTFLNGKYFIELEWKKIIKKNDKLSKHIQILEQNLEIKQKKHQNFINTRKKNKKQINFKSVKNGLYEDFPILICRILEYNVNNHSLFSLVEIGKLTQIQYGVRYALIQKFKDNLVSKSFVLSDYQYILKYASKFGFIKFNQELINLIQKFYEQSQI